MDSAWVHAAGEVDMATAPQLDRALREARAHARLVVLDLRAVSFLDSTGIHVLVRTATDARAAGGQLTIVRGPAQVRRVLTLMGVDAYLPVIDVDSVEGDVGLRG